MTRRELFLAPFAAAVLRMAQRSLPAADGKPVPLRKYNLTFDVGVMETTVISVMAGGDVVGVVNLPPGKHHVEIPLAQALSNYMLQADKPMAFTAFDYRIIYGCQPLDELEGDAPKEKFAFCGERDVKFF